MMHRFSIGRGRWERDGAFIGDGYSGYDDGDGVPEPGEGKGDVSKQQVRNVGPIPLGKYKIGPPFKHPSAGAVTMRLTPLPGTDTFGRSGFLVHGDFLDPAKKGSASHGCIVLGRMQRSRIAEFVRVGDDILEVVP